MHRRLLLFVTLALAMTVALMGALILATFHIVMAARDQDEREAGVNAVPAVWPHAGGVVCLTFSPDGKYLASGSRGRGRKPGLRWQGELHVVEVETEVAVATRSWPQWCESIALAPDGKTLAAAVSSCNTDADPHLDGYDPRPGELVLLEFPSLNEKSSRKFADHFVEHVRFGPAGLAVGTVAKKRGKDDRISRGEPEVLVLDPATGAERVRLADFRDPLALFTFAPDDGRLAISGLRRGEERGSGVELIDLANFDSRFIKTPAVPTGCLELSPDGKELLTATPAGEVMVLTVADGADVTPAGLNAADPVAGGCGCWSADGRYLFAANTVPGPKADTEVRAMLWDRQAKSGKVIRLRDWSALGCCAFSPDGKTLALGTLRAEGTVGAVLLYVVDELR